MKINKAPVLLVLLCLLALMQTGEGFTMTGRTPNLFDPELPAWAELPETDQKAAALVLVRMLVTVMKSDHDFGSKDALPYKETGGER